MSDHRTVQPRAAGTASFRPSRRRLLQTGLAGSLLLAASGLLLRHALRAEEAPPSFAAFDARQRRILAAVAPVILSEALPPPGRAREEAVRDVLRGCDTYMARMSLPVQDEAREALELLDWAVPRLLLGGMWSPWERAGPREIAGFLSSLRGSSLALKRSIYQFLHDMCLVGWYGNPRSWAALGYPGPPRVPRPGKLGPL